MKEKGEVTEALSNNLYRVQMENGNILTCYLAGKMRLHKIRVMVADRVEVLIDPYGGKATNRIVKRL